MNLISVAHRRNLLFFLTLSGADLWTTRRLFARDELGTYECNPLADWFLQNYGWFGLIAFKCATVVGVAFVSLLIARHHPRTSARVLAGCCGLLTGVVLYSCLLPALSRLQASAEDHALRQQTERLDAVLDKFRDYQNVKQRLIVEMLAERCTFCDAMDQLIATEIGYEDDWLQYMQDYFPNCNRVECLAGSLLRCSLMFICDKPEVRERLTRDWTYEYRTYFQKQDAEPGGANSIESYGAPLAVTSH